MTVSEVTPIGDTIFGFGLRVPTTSRACPGLWLTINELTGRAATLVKSFSFSWSPIASWIVNAITWLSQSFTLIDLLTIT
jgi:hypothetical protein